MWLLILALDSSSSVFSSSTVQLVMDALWSTAGRHIFALWLLSFFFPRLISAVADWMSTYRWPNVPVWPGQSRFEKQCPGVPRHHVADA